MIPLVTLSMSRNCLAHLHQLRIRLPSRFSSVARTLIPYFINSVIYVEQSTMVVGSHDGCIIENAEHDCYHLSDWCQVCLFHGLCAVFLQSLARCLVTKKQKHMQRNTSWPTMPVPPLPCCAALPLPVPLRCSLSLSGFRHYFGPVPCTISTDSEATPSMSVGMVWRLQCERSRRPTTSPGCTSDTCRHSNSRRRHLFKCHFSYNRQVRWFVQRVCVRDLHRFPQLVLPPCKCGAAFFEASPTFDLRVRATSVSASRVKSVRHPSPTCPSRFHSLRRSYAVSLCVFRQYACKVSVFIEFPTFVLLRLLWAP